jgi:hypothetical protein
MDILIQDVDNIEGKRPAWLRGVPTAVRLPGREVLVGTQAVEAVAALCEGAIQGVNGFSFSGRDAAAPLEGAADETRAAAPFDALFTCADDERSDRVPLDASDARYRDRPKEKQNEMSLEEVLRRRGATT